jgi:two-component system OmpR family sensor kinase
VKRGRIFASGLLLRVFLYGVLLLLLAGGASFVVGSYVITPAVEGPARPSTAWIAWHLLEIVDEPERVKHELSDLKQRARVEMTLFERDGRLIASNASPPLSALGASELSELVRSRSQFSGGRGAVALVDARGSLLRYARVTYPVPEAPLGSAMAQLFAALAVLAVLSIPLARSLTAPLERLGKVARALGSGDLSARSQLQSRDEIGDLGRTFDEMADRVVSLRRSEKELLANVSHELRTPLARIRMALELAREGDTERAAGYLSDIEEDLIELERLLDDVMTAARLDLSRGAGGDPLPPLRRRTLSAAELLEAARSRFEKRVPGRTLSSAIAPDAPDVVADPSLLRRVLDNLLDNAAKFSEPTSPIQLEAGRGARGALVITVSDRGIGIEEAELERVFEPFYRTDRSRARETGGVGLGLALARRIVESHGGVIVAERGLSGGSTFRVSVPGIEASRGERSGPALS